MSRSHLIAVSLILIGFVYCLAVLSRDPYPNLSRETKSIVNRIQLGGKLTSAYIGIAGRRSKQFDNYLRLADVASDSELVELVSHRSSVVRCYALLALRRRGKIDITPYLEQFSKDPERIAIQIGCVTTILSVRQLITEYPGWWEDEK